MTTGERFTLGIVASATATIFIRTVERPDTVFGMVFTLIPFAALVIMGLVLMTTKGTNA